MGSKKNDTSEIIYESETGGGERKGPDCLEGEEEMKDPKSGQDGQVSAIGKGNEAKQPNTLPTVVLFSPRSRWGQHGVLQHTATHRPHSAGGVGDNPERRSGQKKPSRSSMAEKYHGPTTFQTPLKPLKDSLPHSPFKM